MSVGIHWCPVCTSNWTIGYDFLAGGKGSFPTQFVEFIDTDTGRKQRTSKVCPYCIHSKLPTNVEWVSFDGTKLVLRMTEPMPMVARGHILLELEKRLHREVDMGLEVLLEPMADKNKPRIKLRGVVMQ